MSSFNIGSADIVSKEVIDRSYPPLVQVLPVDGAADNMPVGLVVCYTAEGVKVYDSTLPDQKVLLGIVTAGFDKKKDKTVQVLVHGTVVRELISLKDDQDLTDEVWFELNKNGIWGR